MDSKKNEIYSSGDIMKITKYDSTRMAKIGRGYGFYLAGARLPIPPSSLVMKVNNQNKTINLINEGQVNLPRSPGLLEISFTLLIPQQKYPFAVYGGEAGSFYGADYFLSRFEKLKKKKKPTQFIVCRNFPNGEELFHNNIKVTLEDYIIREDSVNGTDLEIDINLKEYKNFGTIPIPDKKKVIQPKKVRPTDNAPEVKTYTVLRGDCLWAIAQRFLGDGNRYPEIYKLNQALIDGSNKGTGNPTYTIYPNQIFKLPSE